LRSSGRTWLLGIAMCALTVGTASPGLAASGPWTVIPSPSPSTQANYLDAVVALSTTNAWAVGAWYRVSTTSTPGTLTERWNGTRWRAVPSPNATDGYNELFGVDALSGRSVWAVGYSNIANYGSERSLILRWNGTAWQIVPSPNLGTNANILYDVDVLAPGNAWAVGLGDSTSIQSGDPLIEHWNGSAWSLAQSPSTGSGFAQLSGVAGVAANDVWAVGTRAGHTLVEHWNGSTWQIVPSPDGPGGSNSLEAVAAIAADNVWAVGASGSRVLVEHWNGTAWSVVSAPNGALSNSVLTDMVALSATDIVAVGYTVDPLLANNRTLTEHFDGFAWSVVPSPNPSTEYNTTTGVGGLAGGDVWAVGNADESTLTMRASDPG
jgi:hypothetical protein